MNEDHISAARNIPIEHVLDQRGIKLRGKVERVGPCPKCGGTDRFSINTQKRVFNCRGCNAKGDVIALVMHLDGVEFSDAVNTLAGPFPKANGKDTGARDGAKKVSVKSFEYTDANGELVFIKDRFQFKKRDGSYLLKDRKPKKTFAQRRPDPDRSGEFLWNMEGVPALIYRLPEVIEAVASDHPILIVEGEAKADLLACWNIAATCNAGGAKKKWKKEHAEFLRGADVVLVPDNDDAGWQHANAVGASLAGIASRIRVLVLPGLPTKGDVVDWAEAGGTREQLDALIADAPEWHAPSAEQQNQQSDDERAKAKAREDELLAALAEKSGLDYERGRKAAAEELGVRAAAIDSEVRARREDQQVAPLYGHWVVEPSPEVADGDALLRDIIRRIKRHVIISDDGALVAALWIMLSWVHDEVAVHSPILNINSAEPESGKSTLMGLVAFLMPKCIASVEASEAAIYRAIKRWQPSFAFDEFDSILVDDDKAGLRSVINSGHTRGQGVLRCIGDDKVPELFPTFAPKAVGMVGRKLPPATLSRCIFVELRRRKKEENVEKFEHKDDAGLADLRSRLRRWSLDNADTLRDAKPSMPVELQNRREDNRRLQSAIADLCDGVEGFGEKARAAAIRIEGRADSRTIGVRLLADIKKLFDADPLATCMSSATMVAQLAADAEASWAEFSRGKPLTQNRLAKMLGGPGTYGIVSRNVTPPGEKQAKGYLRADFEDAWAIYVP
jgi:hypothetical protein